MIKVISKHFNENLTQGKLQPFVPLICLTCFAKIAQISSGKDAAIEYCEDRAWAFTNSYRTFLVHSAIPRLHMPLWVLLI